MRRTTRTVTLIAVVLAAAVGAGRALQPPPAKPAGRPALLSAPRDRTDFGEVWEDQRFAWTLPLTNTTADAVRVVDVGASCTCVAAEPRAFTLSPGETRELKLTFDLTPKPNETLGTTRTFAAEVGVVAATGDLPPEAERFAVRGTVRPVLAVQTADPSFGTRSDRVQPPLPASFGVAPAAVVESLTAVCDSPGFTADVRPAGGAMTVTVTPTRAIPVGAFAVDVRLIPVGRGGRPLPERRVKVLGRVAPDFTTDPPQVTAAARPVGESFEELVTVGSLTGREVTVVSATAHGDGVAAGVMPGGAVRVRLTVGRAGEVRGRVEVSVRAGKDAPAVVTVPVLGYGTAGGPNGGQP